MKLATYRTDDNTLRTAVLVEDGYVDLNRTFDDLPTDMTSLLALGEKALVRVAEASTAGSPMPASAVRLTAPVPRPEKIFCIGLNYADHAAESGQPAPSEPVVFSKFVNAVAGPDDRVPLPEESQQVDYEAELVVVIGRGGRHIPRDQAMQHVAGYCCGHDVSARDWQLGKPGGQWLLGKTFDGFAPMGPWLVTRDEIADPGQLDIGLRLNGQTMQDSNTRQLIFGIDHLVSYLSNVCTLSPGDVIFTGTPPGVGMARKPPVFLKPGDTAEVEIAGLGVLRNTFVAAGQ